MKTKLRLPNVPKDVNRDMTVLLTAIKEAIEYMSAHGAGADNTSEGYFERLTNVKINDLNKDFGATLDDAFAVSNLLNILNGSITESQLFKDLGDKISKIEITETDLNLAKIELDEAKAGVGELNEAVFTEAGVVARNKLELRAEFDSALNGDSPNSVKNLIEKNTAAIDQEALTRASDLEAYAQTVSTLQTTVDGNTASLETIGESIDGVKASWRIRADVNGLIGGIGFDNDGQTIDFIVRASTFAVAGPSGSSSTPFTVVNTPMTINGVAVPVGTYMTSAYIMNGTITSAKIGNAQVDTLQIKGEAVTVPSAASRQELNINESRSYDVLSVPMDAGGGRVLINLGFAKLYCAAELNGRPGDITFTIERNGVEIYSMMPLDSNTDFTTQTGTSNNGTPIYARRNGMLYNYINIPAVIDQPPNGNNIYSVKVRKDLESSPSEVVLSDISLSLMGIKR